MSSFEYADKILPLAREASRLLADLCQGDGSSRGLEWKGRNDPVTEADRAVHRLCASELPRLFPGIPLISEEGEGESDSERFWSLDPVDGTAEFVDHLGEWAFQLALVERARPVASVLGLSAVDRLYYAESGRGCAMGRALADRALSPLELHHPLRRERLVVTRSLPRRPSLQALVEAHPGQDPVLLGGVGYKVHALLSGEGDTYFAVPGTLHPWDLAAPLLVAVEAGLECRTFSGQIPSIPGHRHSLPDGHVFTRPGFLPGNLEFFARPDMLALACARDPR